MTGRPCVVTIEGTAKPLDHDPTKVRVTSTSGVFVLDTGAMDVRLEYLDDQCREWAPGDVIVKGVTVLVRGPGWLGKPWRNSAEPAVAYSDAAVQQWVAEGAEVLRYQGKRVA